MQALLQYHASELCRNLPSSFDASCIDNTGLTVLIRAYRKINDRRVVWVQTQGDPLTWALETLVGANGTPDELVVSTRVLPKEPLPHLDLWLGSVSKVYFANQTVVPAFLSWPWQNLTELEIEFYDPNMDVHWPETLKVLGLANRGTKQLTLRFPPNLTVLKVSEDSLLEPMTFLNRAPPSLWKLDFLVIGQARVQGVPEETFPWIREAVNVAFLDHSGKPFYPTHLKTLSFRNLCSTWEDQGLDFQVPQSLSNLSLTMSPSLVPWAPNLKVHIVKLIKDCKSLSSLKCSDCITHLHFIEALDQPFESLRSLSLNWWNMQDKLPCSLEELWIQDVAGQEIRGFPENLKILSLETETLASRIELPPRLELFMVALGRGEGTCQIQFPESCRFFFGLLTEVSKATVLQVSRVPRYSVLLGMWNAALPYQLKENLLTHPELQTWPGKNCGTETRSTPGSPKGMWPTSEEAHWLLNCYH